MFFEVGLRELILANQAMLALAATCVASTAFGGFLEV
jgi:hypothetical protein